MRYCVLLITLLFFSSCQKETSSEFLGMPNPNVAIGELKVNTDFDFETSSKIRLQITDPQWKRIKYTVFYAYGAEREEKIASFFGAGGTQSFDLVLPKAAQQIKLVRNHNGNQSSRFLPVRNGQIIADYSQFGKTNSCSETLYAVNGQGGFYTIDVESGTYAATTMPNLVGGGSIACAVDQENGLMYYNTGTTLRYFDYNAGTFHIAQQGNPFGGAYPRMEYNYEDSLLYIAKNELMYTLDPQTNQVVSTYNIIGLESPVGGGDVAISKDSTIYMCCFSGLYRINIVGGNAYATRISAENLPFQPTSMAIDRDDRLYLATNDANSKLIEMDKYDGAWAVVQTYPHKINDLGSYKCEISQLANIDSDNDGVIDQLDDFPNDPTAAEAIYTPSDIGWGSLAFEDLWPSNGDYDFNDLVLNYRFTQISNAANQVVRLEARFRVKALGAGLKNGFGFKMNLNSALISSVTGSMISGNYISLDAKGLESGHADGSTIIVFDNARDHIQKLGSGRYINTERGQPISTGEEINILIEFTAPIDPALIGAAPFDPFLIVNEDRGREIHLSNKAPTDLGSSNYFGTVHDNSDPTTGIYYRNANGLPWAINIIHDFRYPEEKKAVNLGYNYFNSWAQSSGTSYADWYKDNEGYRNTSHLIISN